VSAGQEVNEDDKARGFGAAGGFLDWVRMTSKIAPPCQMGIHDVCDEMTARFVDENPEAAPYDCYCRCHMERVLSERNQATGLAASLERECSVRDEALEQIAALIQEIHDWDHIDVDAHSFPDYARGMNRMLDDVHERTGMALRALDSLQRRLDPFRDDEGEAQQ
jgi:hypothetical protein